MRIAVFTYDFPHWKTQQFLLRLWVHRFQVMLVVAAPPVPKPSAAGMRVKPKHTGVLHPREICDAMSLGGVSGWPAYIVCPHNSEEALLGLEMSRIDIGVVAGAGILPKETIEACKRGIINIHPGLIPDVRGQDSLKWAIYRAMPLGVTAHLIDGRVDAGRVLCKRKIEVYPDDTWVDLSLRLEEVQPEVLIEALKLVESGYEGQAVGEVGKANSCFPVELEGELNLEEYKKRWISTS